MLDIAAFSQRVFAAAPPTPDRFAALLDTALRPIERDWYERGLRADGTAATPSLPAPSFSVTARGTSAAGCIGVGI